MRNIVYGMLLSCLLTSSVYAADEGSDLKALTAEGDQVVLHANGRWEFIDTKKAAQASEVAKQYPEIQGCPAGSQGGLFGLGRCIPIGDKDFNRGSGSGKGR